MSAQQSTVVQSLFRGKPEKTKYKAPFPLGYWTARLMILPFPAALLPTPITITITVIIILRPWRAERSGEMYVGSYQGQTRHRSAGCGYRDFLSYLYECHFKYITYLPRIHFKYRVEQKKGSQDESVHASESTNESRSRIVLSLGTKTDSHSFQLKFNHVDIYCQSPL